MTFFDYLLRANVCLVALFGLYWLLFRQHTFFALNRSYLLLSLLASALLPLIQLPAPAVTALALPAVTLPVATVTLAAPTGPSVAVMLGWVYLLGVALGVGRLLRGLWQLAQLIRPGERLALPDFTLVLVDDERVAPFSFFRFLVMNRADFAHHPDPVLRHEQVHIRQGHSADVLLAEVVKIGCWFNPAAWLLQRALQQTHEFLADQLATDPANRADYARFLVGYALGTDPDALTNSFVKPSQLRLRLTMLLQTPTTRRLRRRYWAVLPALLVLTGLVAARHPMEPVSLPVPATADSLITVTGGVTDDTNKPLAGASIVVRDGTVGTTTDPQGRFSLKNVPAHATLVVSFVGFKTTQIALNGRPTVVMVRLERSSESLDEVVSTFYPNDTTTLKPSPVVTQPSGFTGKAGEVFTVVEQQPEFPGGMSGLGRYLSRSIRYPAEAAQAHVSGKVFVQFVVDETGQISQPRIVKSIGFGCDEEAVRVISQMPRWAPGRQNGQPVAVQYNLPIMFALGPLTDPPAPDSVRPVEKGRPVLLREAGKKMLYLVDGVEVDPPTANKLNTATIQSVKVLSDESAKAYGPKGADGVIIITTKKAQKP